MLWGGWGRAGRLVRIHPPGWLDGCDGLPETGGQAAKEGRGMAGGHELVAGSTAFGLRALSGQQVPETGGAADQLARSGYLEALGDGLFGLLHERSGGKQRTPARMASILSDKVVWTPSNHLTPRQAGSYRRAGPRARGFTTTANRD